MKKFAWMIAILGLCAGSMVACGGDDEKDAEKKANGEACEAATDCISNYCNEDKICADAPANDTDKKANGEACEAATDCKSNYCSSEDKICADDPALEIPECEDNGDCENHTEGKLVCNVDAGVCVECLADNKEDDACDGSKPGPICVENVCSKCTDNAQCGENQECDLDSGKCVAADGTCLEDKDCKDPAKPYCGDNYTCTNVAPSTPSNCDECDGVCVGGTTCVPTVNVDDSCDATFVTRCDGLKDILICKDNVVTKIRCNSDLSLTCQETLAGYAECVEECPEELKEGDIQYADCDKAVAYRYVCRPAYNITETLFAFETVEDCSTTAGNTCQANAANTEALCVAATPAE